MPRISANKLGEFLVTANPVRRRRILSDQKNPAELVVPLYRQAMEPISRFLDDGGKQTDSIYAAIDRLRADESGTDWAINDRKNTAEALENFIELSQELPFESVTYHKGRNDPPKLSFSGVAVSVRPDFLIQFERRGKRYSGAVKLHFIKSAESALQQKGSAYVATLLHRWLQENAPQDRPPHPAHCFSIDVFRRSIVVAPTSFVKRVGEIDAACQEIAARWHSI